MLFLKINTPSYKCDLELNSKVTFVLGGSGVGKSELVRKLQMDGIEDFLTISDGFDFNVISCNVFNALFKTAKNHINDYDNLSNSKKLAELRHYWSDRLNFPFSNSVLIVDDEDFVDSIEFQAFFDSDESNYYLLINRRHINRISYSVDDVYEFKSNGVFHYLEKRYDIEHSDKTEFDYILTEGVGSDYVLFKSYFGDGVINPMFGNKIQSGGRTNVVKMIVSNSDYFRGKSILVLIDYVAFGSNFESFVSICNSLDVDFHIFSLYRSFEYFLLRSNIIKDSGLDLYVSNNFLKFNSLENLYTKRLKDLTKILC